MQQDRIEVMHQNHLMQDSCQILLLLLLLLTGVDPVRFHGSGPSQKLYCDAPQRIGPSYKYEEKLLIFCGNAQSIGVIRSRGLDK